MERLTQQEFLETVHNIVNDFNWRVNRKMEELAPEIDASFFCNERGTIDEINDRLAAICKSKNFGEVRKAWDYCFPDEDFPRKIRLSDDDAVRDIVKNNPHYAEQLSCLLQDALFELVDDENDYRYIMEDENYALSLWKWDDGKLLAFLTAFEEVLLEKKND